MKIQVEVEIFDDPELCENNDLNCGFSGKNAVNKKDRCLLFWKDLSKFYETEFPLLEKCDKCKAAYQKAKNDQ